MPNYEGQDGLLVLGGILVGSPILNGALTAGATTMSIDAVSLTGIVAVGDTFTIAGESGSPTHTVTGGPFYVAVANAIAGITFSVVIAAGGVVDGAAVTFASNSVGELSQWALNDVALDIIDDTVKGDTARTFKGGLFRWSGSARGWLDYDDAQQKSLIDEIVSATPDGTIAALVFQIASAKIWYGGVELLNLAIVSPEGTVLAPVSFDFQGSGALLPDWTP